MSGFVYHGCLAPLEDACQNADGDMLCISDLMSVKHGSHPLLRKLSIAFRHIILVFRLTRNRRRSGVLVRDFSNIPLDAVFPLIKWMKLKMFFLVNHNLQWTLGNDRERIAFCRLGHRGCRFLFLEHVPTQLLSDYGIDISSCRSLPMPISISTLRRDRRGGVKTVGVIGQYRPEKGIDALLEQLEPLAKVYRIMLALPNIGTFINQSRYGSDEWFTLVDSSSSEDYMRIISECDVVTMNHPVEGYEYRASGLIADAAAADVPVVVRNLSMLKHQISEPVCIGECFNKLLELPSCIERVSKKLSKGEYDFTTYRNGRSVEVLAQRLTEIFKST
jgi:glycosyltransferase involved in cell wall biosynthesis